jgi:hypothetical protein
MLACSGAALARTELLGATPAPVIATTPAPVRATTPAPLPVTTPAATGAMAMYRPWDLVCNGVDLARFSNAGGLGIPIVVVHSGGSNGAPVTSPASTKPVVVTLTAGQAIGGDLEAWMQADRAVPSDKRSCQLTATTAQGVVTAKWWLAGAWPSRLEFPTVKRNSLPISELQLTAQSATHQ